MAAESCKLEHMARETIAKATKLEYIKDPQWIYDNKSRTV